uniref:Protein kinase domain-containing protein n=1 Tax=Amphimedon queenslandica TaxID=400682 RepID=A0A1X7T9B2_AMPQE
MSNKAGEDVEEVVAGMEYPVIEEISLKFKPENTLIGVGASGRVRFATHKGRDVAVKYFRSVSEKEEFEQEVLNSKALQNHDNIVAILGTGPNKLFIVREFAPYSLNRVLHGSYPHRYTYEYDHVMHWARQIAVGLEYLHSVRIIYRGVEPSNLLLFGNGSLLKLCDFSHIPDALLCGPVRYIAPEVFLDVNSISYPLEKRDIFDFAITLWEMLARQEPVVTGDDTKTIFEMLNQMANAVGKWMEEGSVDLTVTRVNMLGAPGAGKTCSQLLLLNEDPPTNDTSTPIACPAVRATKVAVSDKLVWNRVTRANLLDELATDLTTLTADLKQEKTKEPPVPAVLSLPDNTVSSAEVSSDLSPTPHVASPAVSSDMKNIKEDKKYHTEAVVQEILATQPKGIHISDHWLYVIDSGGQPAYQELLPLFTRAASLNIITLDLSKPFNERFDLMYRIDGQYFPCHSKSTQLAFFQSAVSTGASFKPLDISCISKKPTHSMHLVLGTHYDKVSDATLKDREEILKSSMSSLESYLQNCVIHQSDDSIIFPINTISASEERAKYSEEICKAIWLDGSAASLKIKIPIRWFAFELSLPDKQSIVSVKEALSIGERYGMNEEDTKQALRYFHDTQETLNYIARALNAVNIIGKAVQREPTYESIIGSFINGMKLKDNYYDIEEHCVKFLTALSGVGGPVAEASDMIKKKWMSICTTVGLNITFEGNASKMDDMPSAANAVQMKGHASDKTTNLLLDKKPEKSDLLRLFKSSAAHYMIIGTAFDVEVDDLSPHNPEATTINLIKVFQKWLHSNNDVTWRNIVQVCEDYPDELGEAKANVQKFLLSDRALAKYLK